jgi:hypothetical protein
MGDFIQVLLLFLVVLYAPFAKTWKRAAVVVVATTVVWSICRVITIILFNENSPPMIGFVMMPFLAAFYAFVLRLIKGVVFCIPWLKKIVKSTRDRISKGSGK